MESRYSPPDPLQTDLFLEEPVVYGSFGERFLASFLDGIIVGVFNFLLEIVIADEIYGIAVSLAVNWLYFAIQESSEQQATFGKEALGLRVTSASGERINFGLATVRHLSHFVSALILGIGYLMMLWDDKKQTLHDKMASTFVVKC